MERHSFCIVLGEYSDSTRSGETYSITGSNYRFGHIRIIPVTQYHILMTNLSFGPIESFETDWVTQPKS